MAQPVELWIKRCQECGIQCSSHWRTKLKCPKCKSEGLDYGRVIQVDYEIPGIVSQLKDRLANEEPYDDLIYHAS